MIRGWNVAKAGGFHVPPTALAFVAWRHAILGAAAPHQEVGYVSVQLMPVPHPRIGAPFVAATLLVVFAGGVVTGLGLPHSVETGSQGAAVQDPAVQAEPPAPVADPNMSDAAYAAFYGGSVQTPAFPRRR
jgi:hypothetical protein